MKQVVNIMKALGEENRFRIVMMLRERPLCVCEVCSALDISLSTVSTHLKQLTQAGILRSRKEGRWVVYSLADTPYVLKLVEQARNDVKDQKQLVRDVARVREVDPKTCAALLRKEQEDDIDGKGK